MTKPVGTTTERSEAERLELSRLGTLCTVKAGCALTTEGTPGRDAFYVVAGQARVTADGVLLAHIGPDEFIGEMALLDDGLRSATVVAETPMQVLAFDASAFAALLDHERIARGVQRQLVARLRAARQPTNPTNLRRKKS